MLRLRHGPAWLCAFAMILAPGCSGEKKEEPGPGRERPFVPDPETWGRDKERVDEEHPAGQGELKAGVAVRMIHGPVGASMAGYGGRASGRRSHWSDRLKGTVGFYGLQSIKVVALEVGGEKMALVKSPLMSSEAYKTDGIARHLDERHSLDFEGRVIYWAGHSHHTTARYWQIPEFLGNVGIDTFDAEITDTNIALFADAIAEAWEQREPAEWAHGYQDDWDPDDEVYRDRRSENLEIGLGKDPRLSLVAFRRKADSTPLAVIINLPIHGTVLGSDNDLFSEDAGGYIEHKFEEAFFAQEGKPVLGMFAQSAGGDASPARSPHGHPDLPRLEYIGEAAAPKILALYDSLEWSSETEMAVRSQRIELVHERIYKNRPWEDEFENEEGVPYTWGGWQCIGSGVSEGESMEGSAKLCTDIKWLLEALDSEIPHNVANQIYLTVARLGDLWMMTIPGEACWSIVKYAREEAAKRTWNGEPLHLMVIGFSQDHQLYITAPDDWYWGGYEQEMSLWGPGGGVFLADESLAVIDAMIDGYNAPTLFAESPPLARVFEWTPRPRERSLNMGDIAVQPEASVARTETVQFAANCGDPALGSPSIRVQREQGGSYVDIPAPHGWEGSFYDNSRYEMVSVYEPDPPQVDKESVEERTHLWRFYWQVPPDWPAGTYRMHLECKALPSGADSEDPEELELASSPFEVGVPEGASLEVSLDGTTLTVGMRVPGVEKEMTEAEGVQQGEWASAGYRLLDRHVAHTDDALVRADLRLEVLDEEGEVLEEVEAPFEHASDRNVVTLGSPPPAGEWSVRAWLVTDDAPAKVSVTINPEP